MHLAQIRRFSLIRTLLTDNYCSSALNLNYMINDCVRNGRLDDARQLFDLNPKSRDTVSWNSMIAGYIKSDQILHAQELFDEMPRRDVVSWNTMLMGFMRTNDSEKVFRYFVQMQRIGIRPTEFTLSTVITSMSNTGFHCLIPQIHAHVISLSFSSSVFLGSALIGGYVNLGSHVALHRVFDEIAMKDVTSWNALISGYMNLGCLAEGCAAFEMMPERNVVSWTTMVTGLIYNKKIDEARVYFDRMPEKNAVSWTVMISGYERSRRFLEALELFIEMRKAGVVPTEYTLSSVMSACAGCSSLRVGRQVHLCIMKSGQPVDTILSSSIVDMYSKCGDIEESFRFFESISRKNLVAWNSMIGGFAGHGLGTRALEEFERMKKLGVKPDHITLVNVLSACAREGLVDKGEHIFTSMEREHGIQSGKEHFACMVDLYGRAGELEKAKNLIRRMPFEPDIVIWGALLGACELHSSLDLGMFAAEGLYKLEQDHPAVYFLLSKIHAEKGVWNKVTELRTMMTDSGAKKQKAGSWIEESSI